MKTPENTPEGFKLIAHNQHIFLLIVLLLPTIFILISVILSFPVFEWIEFILMFLSKSKQFFMGNISSSDLTIWKWEACIFGVIIIFISCISWLIRLTEVIQLIWALIQHLIKFNHPGELYLSHYPLKLGGSCQITYRRPLRSGISLKKDSNLKASLLCSERITSGSSSKPRISWQEIILEESLINQIIATGTQVIEFTTSIEIPKYGNSSFEAEHNRIVWEIEVDLQLEGMVFTNKKKGLLYRYPRIINSNLSTFAFAVDPELVG